MKPDTMPPSRYSVAVVGAGMAGLTCASALQAAGLKVRLFEKSRGVGGRLSTRRTEDWEADHGAQYFTASSAPFRAQVAAWLEAGMISPWAPRLAVIGPQAPRAEGPSNGPRRYVGMPGMSGLAKALAVDLDVRTQHTVTDVARETRSWRLATREHGWQDEAYDALVIAVPAPQVAPFTSKVSPLLGELARSGSMQPCWTLMAQFDHPVELPFEAAFVNQGALRWVARNSSKPGRRGQESWVLQAGASWSQAHLEDDETWVMARMIAAFQDLGGPRPVTSTLHRWRYADTEPLSAGFAWDPDTGAGLCGDWLSGGKVEGAWLSGRNLAHTMVKRLVS